jgi:hypothetical protein
MLMILAALSIALGNLAAIAQTNLKRMLAYSAISHMGFMLLGLLAGIVGGDPRFALNAYTSATVLRHRLRADEPGFLRHDPAALARRLRSREHRGLQGPQQAQPLVRRHHADAHVLDGRGAVLRRLLCQVRWCCRRWSRQGTSGWRCSP